MEGPTPVSALIHAATMVTAGVYLLVRASPIFEAAPDVQHLAAILGALTLLVAGVVALVQWDIKRVIAYSTMSQIGYMFLAAGIGAYGYAIFHLMTHAFFKALLFMSAGLVIHHLGGEQDIRKMGGLKALMPRTHVAFLVGSLALAGIPIFSGFLVEGRHHRGGLRERRRTRSVPLRRRPGRRAPHGALHLPALLQRLPRRAERLRQRARSRGTRRGAAVDARPRRHLLGARDDRRPRRHPRGLGAVPALDRRDRRAARHATVTEDYGTSAIAVSLALVGFFVARRAFAAGRQVVTNPGVWRVLEHKLYFDELYDALFYQPAAALSHALRRNVEEPVVERSLDEIGSGTIQIGGEVARVQSGLLRTYAVAIAFAVCVLVVVFVAVR